MERRSEFLKDINSLVSEFEDKLINGENPRKEDYLALNTEWTEELSPLLDAAILLDTSLKRYRMIEEDKRESYSKLMNFIQEDIQKRKKAKSKMVGSKPGKPSIGEALNNYIRNQNIPWQELLQNLGGSAKAIRNMLSDKTEIPDSNSLKKWVSNFAKQNNLNFPNFLNIMQGAVSSTVIGANPEMSYARQNKELNKEEQEDLIKLRATAKPLNLTGKKGADQ